MNAKERVISNDYFRFVTPGHNSYDELEEIYWNGTVDRTENPIYGADVQGTLIGGFLFPHINLSTRDLQMKTGRSGTWTREKMETFSTTSAKD